MTGSSGPQPRDGCRSTIPLLRGAGNDAAASQSAVQLLKRHPVPAAHPVHDLNLVALAQAQHAREGDELRRHEATPPRRRSPPVPQKRTSQPAAFLLSTAQKAIPSPTRPGAAGPSRQRKGRSKKNKKRKAGGGGSATASADEEDGRKEDTDNAKDEDKASSSSSSNEKSAAAAAAAASSATAAIAPYPPTEVASYYYGPLRIPRTSRSNETEALDSLSALAEKDGDDGDNENGSSKTLPDIVHTLVKASNELIKLLQSSSTIGTHSRTVIPATCSETYLSCYRRQD